MRYLLDTNICIYLIKRRPPLVLERFKNIAPGDIYLSVITVCELSYGVQRSSVPERNAAALQQFLLPFNLLDLTADIGASYGKVRHALKHNPIGDLDLLIAVQALQHNLILVTNNEREFRRIHELRVENWVRN